MTINEIVKTINEKGSEYQKKILFNTDKTFIFDYPKIDNYEYYLKIIFDDYKYNISYYTHIINNNTNLKQSLFGTKIIRYFDFLTTFEPKNNLKETLDYYMLDYDIEKGYLDCELRYEQFKYLYDNGFVLKVLKGDLNCYYIEDLKEINLSELKEINNLYIYQNNLIKLNISKLEKVNILDCSNNKLEKLDLNNLKEINFLNCSNNIKLNRLKLNNLKKISLLNFKNTSLPHLTKDDLLKGFNNFENNIKEYKHQFKYIKSFKLFEQTIFN